LYLCSQKKNSVYSCTSISDVEFQYEDVALTKAGSTCSASSTYGSHYCIYAIDGDMTTQWISNVIGRGNDIWIQVNFKAKKVIFQIALVHRRASSTGPREVTLKFSDDSEQLVSLYRVEFCQFITV